MEDERARRITLSAMRVRGLRELATARNISLAGVLEKREIVDLLFAHRDEPGFVAAGTAKSPPAAGGATPGHSGGPRSTKRGTRSPHAKKRQAKRRRKRQREDGQNAAASAAATAPAGLPKAALGRWRKAAATLAAALGGGHSVEELKPLLAAVERLAGQKEPHAPRKKRRRREAHHKQSAAAVRAKAQRRNAEAQVRPRQQWRKARSGINRNARRAASRK
jgi:hypothetical protein